jgi:hypothetical protein
MVVGSDVTRSVYLPWVEVVHTVFIALSIIHIQCGLVTDSGYSHQHLKSYQTVNQSKHQLKICSVSIPRSVFPLNTNQTRAGAAI